GKVLGGNFGGQDAGGVRADGGLCKTPGGVRISRRKRFDDLVERDEIDAAATQRDRQQYMEQPGSMHGRQDIGRDLPLPLGAAAGSLDQWRKSRRPCEPIVRVLGQQKLPRDLLTSLAQERAAGCTGV